MKLWRAAALFCGLLAGGAFAQAEIAVDVERAEGSLIIEANMSAPVDASLAWQVLTDYDHLADFIPGLHSSRAIIKAGEPTRVEQKGESGFLAFHFPIEIVLEMVETPFRTIRFRAVEGNIKEMEGIWRVHGDDATVKVTYSARMRPDFWVPPLIGSAIIRHDVREQLSGLAREMERRAKLSPSRSLR